MGYRQLIRIFVLLCSSLAAPGLAAAECSEDMVDLRGDWGQARFTVELADDPAERAVGLMNREAMPRNAGMLFVYERPQRATFWMRNTLISLDMIFVDQAGVVQHVHERAIPLDETTIDGGEGIFAVLEVNGGIAELYGIGVGSELRHPAFDVSQAVWPCGIAE